MKTSRVIDNQAVNFTRGFNSNLGQAKQYVSLSFEGSCLPNLDEKAKTKSDPMLVLYKGGNLVGSTEYVTDNLNPKWIKSFDVEYDFSKV